MGLKLSQLYQKLDMIKKNKVEMSFNLVLEKLNKNLDYLEGIKYIDHREIADLEKSIQNLFTEYSLQLSNVEKSINNIFDNNQNLFLSESFNHYQTYFQKMQFEDYVDFHNNSELPSIESEKFIGKIKQHVSWQDPACLVSSKNSKLLKYFPGAEPIYSVEKYREYFDNQLNLFPKSFGKKIRCYTYDEIKYLPKNVFNMIVIYNEFPFLPWIEIKKMLKYFSECLAPEGTLIFNYNNCSTYLGFLDFENKLKTYTTSRMFQSSITELDLEIEEDFDSTFSNFSLFIARKKGIKSVSIKRYPSIGVISQLELNDHLIKVRKDKILRKINSRS